MFPGWPTDIKTSDSDWNGSDWIRYYAAIMPYTHAVMNGWSYVSNRTVSIASLHARLASRSDEKFYYYPRIAGNVFPGEARGKR